MTTVTVDDAKGRLPELVEAAARGETVLIEQNSRFSVRLVPVKFHSGRRQFGSARGLIQSADDFDAPLEDFREYEQ